jgi:DNA-3-methyladenine glycosylase II
MNGDIDEAAALRHLKRVHAELYESALPFKGQVLAGLSTPARTNTALFRALCSSIVSQQLSTKAAASIFARLEQQLGSITSARILDASPGEMRTVGLSAAKIASLKALAEAVHSKKLNLLGLKNKSSEIAMQALTEVRGIGPWTAEMFLIFALGAPDIFSPGDLILARRTQALFNLPQNASKKAITEAAARWAPHRSYVSLLLWKLHHAELLTERL